MGQLKIIKASAGSGKTFMLSYEYVQNVILDPNCYKTILAVTFTKKATGEMKSRILNELYNLTQPNEDKAFLNKLINENELDESTVRRRAQTALNNILHDYSNFSVMTIDGFFQKIVRSFIKELHLECDYTIDFNTNYLLKLAIDNLIHKSEEDARIKSWIEAFIEDNIEASKRVDIKNDMLSLSKMILSEEFDKSYFERYREEMILFFNQLSETSTTIRKPIVDLAQRFLDYCSERSISVEELPGKSRGIHSYISKVAKGEICLCSNSVEKNLETGKIWGKLSPSDTSYLRDLFADLYSRITTEILFLGSIDAILNFHRTFVLLADISRELYELCSSNNKMILSNSNYLINRLVKNNDTPYIYEKIGNNYQIIMIDEFQDTSVGQWENFQPLLENALSEAPTDKSVVTLVGDIKQSIYRWRGGDWRILGSGINRAFYGNSIKEDQLTVNYRSLKEIIEFNNQMVRSCAEGVNHQLNDTIIQLNEEGKVDATTKNSYLDLLSTAYEGMEQECPNNEESGGYIEITKYDSKEEANLDRTIEIIKELQDRGYKANDIAILVRNKKAARKITSYILDYKRTNPEESNNYCFDIIASEGLILSRSTVIKFIMSVYSLSMRVTPTSLAYYNRYLSRELTQELSIDDTSFFTTLIHLPAIESFEKIVKRYLLGENSNNIAYLQAFHSAVINFSGSEIADAASLLEWWKAERENLSVSLPEGQNAIHIETIHKSKGLQYNIVILPYCNWTLYPLANGNFWAKGTDERVKLPFNEDQKIIVSYRKALENSYFSTSYIKEQFLTVVENFNTFYVALTRAKRELYLMIPETSRGKNSINCFVEDSIPQLAMQEEEGKYHYGTKTDYHPKEQKQESSTVHIDRFNHCDLSSRLALHLENDKFFRDLEEDSDSNESIDARGKGILLHKLFEQTTSLEDLPTNIDKLQATGAITRSDADNLKELSKKAMANPLVRGWFDGKWETRSESSILLPTTNKEGSIMTKRPDKVLLKEDCAIVIDYKFGKKQRSHHRQVEHYKELLQTMGYKKIKGYLWYINENNIVEI